MSKSMNQANRRKQARELENKWNASCINYNVTSVKDSLLTLKGLIKPAKKPH